MVQDGVLSEHQMPVHPTNVQGCSLLPTPQHSDYKGPNLSGSRSQSANGLQTIAVTQLLPTPTVVDMGNNKTPDEWEAWKNTQKAKHRNGNGHGRSLHQELIGVSTVTP
jgi:DNA (cytosine-5)-methyltransferase 1